MNVFQMYTDNGNQAGFWIQRDSWGRTVAVVRSVAGTSEGELPGEPPYHGNPVVLVDVYESEGGTIRERGTVLSCPGTHGYRQIAMPQWAGTEEKRNP